MTAKELIESLSKVAPDTEIVGGMWNGRVDTYKVLDELHVFLYDDIFADFYGTPGAFDNKLLNIHSKDVVYLGSMFECQDRQLLRDRRVIWRMERILRMHRSRDWKQEETFKLLTEFAGKQ